MRGKIAPPSPHLIPPPQAWGRALPQRPQTRVPFYWGFGGEKPLPGGAFHRSDDYSLAAMRAAKLRNAQRMEFFRAIIAAQQQMQRT